MVAARGASSLAELQRYQQAWDHAADRTPHGQPIELQPRDFEDQPPPEGRPSGMAGSMRRL